MASMRAAADLSDISDSSAASAHVQRGDREGDIIVPLLEELPSVVGEVIDNMDDETRV